jgi:ATP-dependent exoDNAse (exonuclease V) beta subunit
LLPQRYVRSNPIRIAIETKAVQEEMEEQMRVLYVALTRPQHLLVIVDAKSNKTYASSLTRSAIFRRIGYSGWLATILSNKTSDLYNEVEVIGKISEISAPSISPVIHEFTPILRTEQPFEYQTPSSQEQAFFPDFTLHYRDILDGKERGTRLHRLIERLPMTIWTPALIHSIDPSCTQDEIDALMAFHDSDYYQNAKSAVIEREYPFAILQQNRLVNGIVDMLAIYPDRVELVDFKTDRSGTASQLIERYQGQLRAYYDALRIVYPEKEVKTFLYSFNLREILEVYHENHP